MQLFITDYQQQGNKLLITDTSLLHQLRKVLRAEIGDHIWIQSPETTKESIRYNITIDQRDQKSLTGTISSEQRHIMNEGETTMIVAMPNKWEKIELIVQKLTECGIDQIVFWPSERSIIKTWNKNKDERIHKIIKEATEQSRGWKLPKLEFTTDISNYIKNKNIVVFDTTQGPKLSSKSQVLSPNICGVVGPEGGLTPKDYTAFKDLPYEVRSLGETVLRTETAAIVGGRILKNSRKS